MADICVIHLSEDREVARELVRLLQLRWPVWWADAIAYGDWEQVVRAEIRDCRAVVALVSNAAAGERVRIIRDEMSFALDLAKPVLPFVIGDVALPLGLNGLNRTTALGWTRDPEAHGFQQLVTKLGVALAIEGQLVGDLVRPREFALGNKRLQLPSFVFSLSSHETRITPLEGATLLDYLSPEAVLLSAYDLWEYRRHRERRAARAAVESLKQRNTMVFLDSGNYEASRKSDYQSRTRPNGWSRERFLATAIDYEPDIAFSYDKVRPTGEPEDIVAQIVKAYDVDMRAIGDCDFPLVPIVHLPTASQYDVVECALRIVPEVAAALQPPMIAIPERELGDGLRERANTVRGIRLALNSLGTYYPLHLLGTGNPLSISALAAIGADIFDGLEWCRTVADYRNGSLLHFQHLDIVEDACVHMVVDERSRALMQNDQASYDSRVLSYNVDFFQDWMRTLRAMVHSGQVRGVLRSVPGVGTRIVEDLQSW
jgi:queuine/archaeosine tRNA-ribosyltransferase